MKNLGTMTINQLYDGDLPAENELIWSFISPGDLDHPFRLVEVDPVALAHAPVQANGETLLQQFKEKADKGGRAYVAKMRKDMRKIVQLPIVVSGDAVIDGQHRTIAMAKEKVRIAVALQLEED